MILVDANLLIYASVDSFPQHARARQWLDERLNGQAPVGLPWTSLLAYLRISTNPRVFQKPAPVADGWRQVLDWLGCERAWIPQPTERHRENWMDCIRSGRRPAMDVEIGYRTVTYCILGNMAYTLGRKLVYDVGAERFVNDEEANRLMSDSYRYPWRL